MEIIRQIMTNLAKTELFLQNFYINIRITIALYKLKCFAVE